MELRLRCWFLTRTALLLLGAFATTSSSSTTPAYPSQDPSGNGVAVETTIDAYDNGLGRTPQMGWNPWNLFRCDINETLIQDIASAMVSSGLADCGYEYINLDDCWQVSRNDTGYIVEDPDKFPSGMGSLVETVHTRFGLKLGLYSDSGLFTCQRKPGSFGHETQDAESYAAWKIDYLKYDNCFADGLGGGVQKRYERMRDALNATGRPIFFGLCEWGLKDPALWAPGVGNSWRTTGDIDHSWDRILTNLDENDQWHVYAGPTKGWNDPDILEVGTSTDLTISEQRAHFTLWCLVKAPLLLGNDLRRIPRDIFEILSNRELIAINQDPLGIQGYKRSIGNTRNDGNLEVWAGDLQGGDMVVVLFNRSNATDTVSVAFGDLLPKLPLPPVNEPNDVPLNEPNDVEGSGTIDVLQQQQQQRLRNLRHHKNPSNNELRHLDGNNTSIADPPPLVIVSAHVRDLWAHTDLGIYQDHFEGVVSAHDVIALRLSHVSIETHTQ